jgi:hypothetical protein
MSGVSLFFSGRRRKPGMAAAVWLVETESF